MPIDPDDKDAIDALNEALETERKRGRSDRTIECASLRAALRGLTEFAWSAVIADCEEARIELNGRLERARKALSISTP